MRRLILLPFFEHILSRNFWCFGGNGYNLNLLAARKRWKKFQKGNPSVTKDDYKKSNLYKKRCYQLTKVWSRPAILQKGCGIAWTMLKYLHFYSANCFQSKCFNLLFLSTSQNIIMWQTKDPLSHFKDK